MSQNGAENMAKAGKTYQEILAFYYPGTVLMGSYGKAVIAPNNNQIETEVNTVASAKYGYWIASGTIDTLPNDQNVLLFNRSKTNSDKMSHVGAYDFSTKTELQAGGYGTIITLPSGKRKSTVSEQPFNKSHWTHWCTLDVDWTKVFSFIRKRCGDLYLLKGRGGTAVIDGVTFRVWDCAGIIMMAMREVGLDLFQGATTMYNRGFDNSSAQEPAQEPQEAAYPTLRKGSEGEKVRELQTLLNNHGASLEVDGKFGSKTKDAVISYQKANGLTVDGIVGKNTWNALTA
jgi:hypothetical protein